MKTVIDPGHTYSLLTLDAKCNYVQTLTFVKRCDTAHPEKYPGNLNAYSGTTCQSVIRCLIDRVRYLQNQAHCWQNTVIVQCLRLCLWLFEQRAAHRHGRSYARSLNFAEKHKMCPVCGHTQCEHGETSG